MTSACTHQFTRAATPVAQPEVEQEGHHQREDEAADQHRLATTRGRRAPPAARTRAGRAGPVMPTRTASGERHEQPARRRGTTRAPVRSAMPRPARNSTRRVAARRRTKPQKTPRWASPTSGRSRDRPRLEDDLGDEPQQPAPGLVVADVDVVRGPAGTRRRRVATCAANARGERRGRGCGRSRSRLACTSPAAP